MKRFIILLLISILSLNLVCASDVGYIIRNPSNPSTKIIESLNYLELDYDLIRESNLASTDLSNYRVLIVNERISDLNIDNYPSVIVSPHYYTQWSGSIGSKGSSQILTAFNTDLESPITEGVRQKFPVYTSCCRGSVTLPMYYLSGKKYSTTRITATGEYTTNLGEFVIATKDEPRRVFFGITETDFWTEESQIMFENSVLWILRGEDRDGDGYYANEDCDDNNASINPGAEEIPYNYIDEDCSGYDLADVDSDGYCKLGYVIQNRELQCPLETGPFGTDCDDEDDEINPGSLDVFKNCRNDAPIIEEIDKITVQETEIVEIIIDAIDPEDDFLYYFINDSRFERDLIEENIFRWETNYGNEGNYVFRITVSDGILESEIDIEVGITKLNREPICEEILNLIWNEDETAELNLNDYCYDPDGDELIFSFYDTSDDLHIFLENLTNGIAFFSSEENWFGEDWIVFSVSDYEFTILTNEIVLIVLPVNDGPVFSGFIENITWNKDENLIDYLNLEDYFSDVDSELEYSVIGNNQISIEINDGKVSFYPEFDFYGKENIVFRAFDGEFEIYSNALTLEVLYVNVAPRFLENECILEIDEDENYSCEINYLGNEENEEITLEIVNEDNLYCSLENNILNYVSYLDYNGNASCTIRATNEYGFRNFIFEVKVLPINDAPEIIHVSPSQNPKILENTSLLFSVEVFDVDSLEIDINWFLDGEEVGQGNSHLFEELVGIYFLEVIANDEEYLVSHNWTVVVGDISEFTCDEVGGFLCGINQVCEGDLLGVKNTDKCCSQICSKGPPEFRFIDICDVKDNGIKISIEIPKEKASFDIGEIIEGKLKIENFFNEDKYFIAEIYLYDETDKSEIDFVEKEIKILNKEKKEIYFNLNTDIYSREDHEYYIYVRVFDEDNEKICNDKYVEILLNRPKNKVIIEKLNIDPEVIECGGFMNVKVSILNIGNSNEEVVIILKNSQLGIYEESEKIKIEKYGEKDSLVKFFNIQIPDNAQNGKSLLTAEVLFYRGSFILQEEFSLEKCSNVRIQDRMIELNSGVKNLNSLIKEKNSEDNGSLIVPMIMISLILLIFVGILLPKISKH